MFGSTRTGVREPACGACAFHDLGACYRHAPRPMFFGAFVAATKDRTNFQGKQDEEVIWPRVDRYDWCGEYKNSPQKQRLLEIWEEEQKALRARAKPR